MHALAATHELLPLEEQIKAERVLLIFRVRKRIKGPLRCGVMGDEDEIGIELLQSPLADPALILRGQVQVARAILAVALENDALYLAKLDPRHLTEARHCHADDLGVTWVTLDGRANHMLQELDEKVHHLVVATDKGHLDIEAVVLVEVAHRVVLFGSKRRADLEDTLEHAHHDLLVYLRTLGQICGPPKVIELEYIG